MPQLSSWRIKRNARAREKKLLEAIEMQKLKKAATRRCRNCLNPYRDQNPGGGKFMCSYCGHISKRPVLDLPAPPRLGLSNSGILKYLVEKCGKVFSGKVWFDNGWMCGQYYWLEDSNSIGGSLTGKPSYRRNGAGLLGSSDPCLAEKSCSRILNFVFSVFATFFLIISWLCRKVLRVSSSRDDASDAERRSMLDQSGDTGGNCHESKGEKARRKAEEKRQARLVKELLEEEERKQREEVAKLVEECRRLRDEKMEAEKEHRKGSSPLKERESKKEAEKKRQERKKERDRGSSKSNSDVEELDKRGNKESERYKRSEGDRRDHHKTGPENVKAHGAEVGHTLKGAPVSNTRGNAGTRYFDRVRGTFLSSSRAFTGGGFFGKSSVSTVSREQKSNAFVDHMQATTNRREVPHPDRLAGKSNAKGDDKNISRPVLMESQPGPAPKKSWQQLFTRSSSSSSPCSSNVISRPNGNSKSEVLSSPLASNPPSTQAFDNPINFGFPSPFTLPSVSFGTTNISTGYPFSNEPVFTRIGEASTQYLPEESEVFEDPCYVPDPVSLLGPVSESLDNFQLDLGFIADSGLETPCASKNIPPPAELPRPSPIESPLSRLRVSEEGHASSFSFPSTPKAQDLRHLPVDGSPTLNEAGTWQMWSSSPLGEDGLSLVVGPANWRLPPELNRPKNEDILHPVPQKTMASLFKKDDQVLSGTHSPQMVFVGSAQNGGSLNSFVSGGSDGSWLPNPLFGPTSSSEDQFTMNPKDEAVQSNLIYGSSRGSVPTHQTDVSASNCWAKKEWNLQGSGLGGGMPSVGRPHIGGLYSSPDVQSLWSYD